MFPRPRPAPTMRAFPSRSRIRKTPLPVASELWIALLGAVVGLVMGLTGAGGGALSVPLLIFGAGLSLPEAVPVSLSAVAASASLGGLLGLREGLVRYRAALMIGVAGMSLAPVGVALGQRLPQAPLLVLFAGFMVLTAWRNLRPRRAVPRDERAVCHRETGAARLTWTWACAAVLARTGALAGLLSGLLGVGGGFVIVPILERRSNLDRLSIQATSVAVIALVSTSGLASAAWGGHLELQRSLPFGLGAMAGLLAGRRHASRLPETRLRQVFGATCAAVALLVLARALETPA